MMTRLVAEFERALEIARRLDVAQNWEGRDAWVARLDRIDWCLRNRYGVHLGR
jgi:hypothetical protein